MENQLTRFTTTYAAAGLAAFSQEKANQHVVLKDSETA